MRASSRRVPRARPAAGETTPEADSEPNMRLSRAIVVMLLLHVVAVGGILAFSLIKERNANGQTENGARNPSAALEAEDSLVPSTKPLGRPDSAPGNSKLPVHVVQPGETLLRIANENGVTVEALIAANGAQSAMNTLRPGQELKLPDKSPEPNSATTGASSSEKGETTVAKPGHGATGAMDSGKTYTVGKGESPYLIAHKLKVSYESLLKLNRIDDPKKLKPGQKLRVPVQPGSKSNEG